MKILLLACLITTTIAVITTLNLQSKLEDSTQDKRDNYPLTATTPVPKE